MAKTEIQAASKSGARPAILPPPARYVAPTSPRASAVPSAGASTRMLSKRRRALTPSDILGVFFKNRTVVLRHGVYRPRRRASLQATPRRRARSGMPGWLYGRVGQSDMAL